MTRKQAINRLCLALDVERISEAKKYVKLLRNQIGIFKIGSQLFTNEGPKAVEAVRNLGGKVFLDLKFHDIPNTVANSARMAVKIGAYIFNIHASGGFEMMRAAVDAVKEESDKNNESPPIVLAVTVLTSINDSILSKDLRINYTARSQVLHLARLAQRAQISGVVSSPNEITAIRKKCGEDFIILTPGIRPKWSAGKDDQKRITTPGDAIKLGANYIVIGRPILKANDPQQAVDQIIDEMVDTHG